MNPNPLRSSSPKLQNENPRSDAYKCPIKSTNLLFAPFIGFLSAASLAPTLSHPLQKCRSRGTLRSEEWLVNYGKDYGKLVVIVDVVDQNRALVDAPDMVRGQMNFKRLTLTDITIDIPRVPKKNID
ncbi:uncharacterized protein LOC120204760 [Hibiscus syriacus]|nr:uncharacterized protein LOC120204760 [Hibiscus syriacus]